MSQTRIANWGIKDLSEIDKIIESIKDYEVCTVNDDWSHKVIFRAGKKQETVYFKPK